MNTDFNHIRVLARALKHTKAELHRVAFGIYRSGRYRAYPTHNTWDSWLRFALGRICTPKDLSTLKYTAIVLNRLTHRHIVLNGEELAPDFFLDHRLSYLHDALGTLNRLPDGALFDEVMLAVATLSRDDLRQLCDSLNFRQKDKPACRIRKHGGLTTYLVVCSSDAQAVKVKSRLSSIVYIQQ